MKFTAAAFALAVLADVGSAVKPARRLVKDLKETDGVVPPGHVGIRRKLTWKLGEAVPEPILGELVSPSDVNRLRKLRGGNGGKSGKSGDAGDAGGVVFLRLDNDDYTLTLLNGFFNYVTGPSDDDAVPLCNGDFRSPGYIQPLEQDDTAILVPAEPEQLTTCHGDIDGAVMSPINPETGCTELYLSLAVSNDDIDLYCPAQQKPTVTVVQCINPFPEAGDAPCTDVDIDTDSFPEVNVDFPIGSFSAIIKVECCDLFPNFEIPTFGGSNGKSGKNGKSRRA